MILLRRRPSSHSFCSANCNEGNAPVRGGCPPPHHRQPLSRSRAEAPACASISASRAPPGFHGWGKACRVGSEIQRRVLPNVDLDCVVNPHCQDDAVLRRCPRVRLHQFDQVVDEGLGDLLVIAEGRRPRTDRRPPPRAGRRTGRAAWPGVAPPRNSWASRTTRSAGSGQASGAASGSAWWWRTARAKTIQRDPSRGPAAAKPPTTRYRADCRIETAIRPAFTTDDLPLPEGPMTASSSITASFLSSISRSRLAAEEELCCAPRERRPAPGKGTARRPGPGRPGFPRPAGPAAGLGGSIQARRDPFSTVYQ